MFLKAALQWSDASLNIINKPTNVSQFNHYRASWLNHHVHGPIFNLKVFFILEEHTTMETVL